jgi:energy-coupling factor transporter ATP-binding protein EcfA2
VKAMGRLGNIGTFGDVSAEDDGAVLSYFLKTDAVDRIESGECYAIIGRKGSGKTALTKYFSQPRKEYITTSPRLRDYPWNLHAKRKNLGASDIESYVSSWRYLIAVKANSIILEQRGMTQMTDSQRAAREFLNENYGGIVPSLSDILVPTKINVTKRVLSPSILGNALGSIEFEKSDGGMAPEIDTVTDALLRNASTLASQAGAEKVCIHFDELDQGLSQLDDRRKEMIIGLILAVRSIRSSREGRIIRPAFYIRTDIWDELKFSDKNKISQSSAVYLEWDSDTLLEMINERIKVKLGRSETWRNIEVARTFLRPRDVIQFLNFALQKALKELPSADMFDNDDIQAAREPYSRYLKLELDDEIEPHWAKWSEALQACSELATITFSRDAFKEAYQRRRSSKNKLDADEALEALYGFSVIGYRRGIGSGGSGWVFQYADPDAGWDNGATRLKVHPGLKEFAKLREERA